MVVVVPVYLGPSLFGFGGCTSGNPLPKNASSTSMCAWAPPSMAPHIFGRGFPPVPAK